MKTMDDILFPFWGNLHPALFLQHHRSFPWATKLKKNNKDWWYVDAHIVRKQWTIGHVWESKFCSLWLQNILEKCNEPKSFFRVRAFNSAGSLHSFNSTQQEEKEATLNWLKSWTHSFNISLWLHFYRSRDTFLDPIKIKFHTKMIHVLFCGFTRAKKKQSSYGAISPKL